MLITLDQYYDVDFYNQTLEALKNNNVEYDVYVESIPPYNFYLDVPKKPFMVNFDEANSSKPRYLVSIVKPISLDNTYLFKRRQSHIGKKGFNYYSMNDVFKDMQKSKQGIIFNCTTETATELSKLFPRKIYYLGKYYNNRFSLMACDSLLVKNYFDKVNGKVKILAESKSFQNSTELEREVNFKVFSLNDRIIKVSNTPYMLNGNFHRTYISGNLTIKFGS